MLVSAITFRRLAATIFAGVLTSLLGSLPITFLSLVWLSGTVVILTALLFLLVVKAGERILTENIGICRLRFLLAFLGFECQWLLAVLVHRHNLPCSGGTECHQIGGNILVGRICNFSLENVGFEIEICGVGRFKPYLFAGKLTRCLYI